MRACSAAITVNYDKGLHVRPAGVFAEAARRFSSSVTVERLDNKQLGDGKSLMDLLSLAVVCGTKIHIHAEGDDAEAVIAELIRLVDADFDLG